MSKIKNNEVKMIGLLFENFYYSYRLDRTFRLSCMDDYIAQVRILETLGYVIEMNQISEEITKVYIAKGKRILLDKELSLKSIILYHDNNIKDYLEDYINE